jgi:pSer/pThr/pTyr-binding forkhead associated (FHA) protein
VDAAAEGATKNIAADPLEERPAKVPGAPAQPRLVMQPSNTALPFPTNKKEVIIGREDPISSHFPDVELGAHGGDEGGVSREHARISIRDGQYAIEDLESVNYTFVNKQKLEPGSVRILQDGDELRFGRVVAIFRCT